MGIEMLKQPASEVDAGIFNLPSNFSTAKYAAQWKLKGMEVEKATGRQSLIGTRLTADGWEVYKEKGVPVTRFTAKGEYVLMFRPREVQDAVNAIYGNVGYERMVAHKKNETTGGVPIESEILTEADIARVAGERSEGDGEVVFNKVTIGGEPVEVAPLQTTGKK